MKKFIKAKKIEKLWPKVLRQVLKFGHELDDDGEKLWEVINLTIKLKSPILDTNGLHEYFDEVGNETFEAIQSLFSEEKSDENIVSVDYGSRIFSFNGENQYDSAIKKLRQKPYTKSATISLLDPNSPNKHVPCVALIDFKNRNNKLEMTVYGRSIDAVKKFPADIYALSNLHQKASKDLGLEVGVLTMFVASLHVYEADYEIMHRVVTRWRWNNKAPTWEEEIKEEDHYVNIEDGYQRFLDFVDTKLKDSDADVLLDVGTGTGIVARNIKQNGNKTFGLDIAPKMIEVAESIDVDVSYDVGDALELPYDDDTFDAVVSRGVLISHAPLNSEKKLLQEYFRVLKKEGLVVFDFMQNVPLEEGDMHREKGIYSVNEISSLLVEIGFTEIEFESDSDKRVNIVLAKKE